MGRRGRCVGDPLWQRAAGRGPALPVRTVGEHALPLALRPHKAPNDPTRELARLQESVAWWIPPQGFGYAMTPEGLEQKDYIGVFTRRRGEWIDREFELTGPGTGR